MQFSVPNGTFTLYPIKDSLSILFFKKSRFAVCGKPSPLRCVQAQTTILLPVKKGPPPPIVEKEPSQQSSRESYVAARKRATQATRPASIAARQRAYCPLFGANQMGKQTTEPYSTSAQTDSGDPRQSAGHTVSVQVEPPRRIVRYCCNDTGHLSYHFT